MDNILTIETNMEYMEDIYVKEECEETLYEHELSESAVQSATKTESEENIALRTNNHGFEEILIKEPNSEDSNNQIEEKSIEEENSLTWDEKSQCLICGKILKRINMKNHIKYTHDGIRNYRCNLCNKSFKASATLKYHMTTHTGKKEKFECSICHKSYTKKGVLKTHLNIHTNSTDATKKYNSVWRNKNDEKSPCPICGKKFNQLSNMRKHLRNIHNGTKDFHCNLCKKSFTEKTSLKYHMTSHTGKKEFECDICHQLFPNNNTLKYHLNTHVGNHGNKSKDFQCNQCNKSFTTKDSFEYHMNAHNSIKQFQCHTCQKSFAKKTDLKKHLNLHKLSDQEHTCTICNKHFKHKKTFESHMKAHEGIKDFECPKCQKSFTLKKYLNKHLKLHTLEDQTLITNKMDADSTDSSQDNSLTVENIEDIFVKEENELDKTIVSETRIKEEPMKNSYMDCEDYNKHKEKQCNDKVQITNTFKDEKIRCPILESNNENIQDISVKEEHELDKSVGKIATKTNIEHILKEENIVSKTCNDKFEEILIKGQPLEDN